MFSHTPVIRSTRLIVVAGPPCGGKSVLAGQLSAAIGAPHLEMDQFRKRLMPTSDQRVRHRDIAYRAMHYTVELMAPRCTSIVLDATYTAEPCRADLLRVMHNVGASLSVVECRVGVAAAVNRFFERGAHAALDLTPSRVAVLAADYPYFDGAYGVSGTNEEDVLLADLALHVTGPPMDDARVRGWRMAGQPRESAASRPEEGVLVSPVRARSEGHR